MISLRMSSAVRRRPRLTGSFVLPDFLVSRIQRRSVSGWTIVTSLSSAADFRRLSYGKLRKTAASLIRRFADGEVAGVFLAHGQPVESDDLLEIYSNRPFGKVFDALRRVGEYLQPRVRCRAARPVFGGRREQQLEHLARHGQGDQAASGRGRRTNGNRTSAWRVTG